MFEPEISIADRKIGPLHSPYIICELSANHNGSLERAIKMIEVAAETGADAVKIQTYTADTLTIDCDGPEFQINGGLWDGYTLHKLYREAYTPYEWHPALFERARELGMTIFSTPFDDSAVELLAGLNAPAYKIASFEAIDLPLITRVAREGKPMIISTGMAGLGEIESAVKSARGGGAGGVALLHCTSAYPAPIEAANVRTVPHLAAAFDVVSGLSDHTQGTAAAVAAVALGASIIEKHFTLSRADGGPDAAFSLEPDEFNRLIQDCKSAWTALGRVDYLRTGAEKDSAVFRRSLYVVENIRAGEILTASNIRAIRPGFGLAPKHLPKVLG
ncbi:MAG: pseudaminic acid synthase, partial [Gammaproteobacteria bacterium]